MALALFLASILLIFYHHVGYPFLLHALAEKRRRAQESRTSVVALGEFPSVTVIVPAHNEAAVIAAKISNLAAFSYPKDKLSFIIALDGCTDETRRLAERAIAESSCPSCFEVIEYTRNIGKVAVLNDCIERTSSDIVALSDASALVNQNALTKAALHFADLQVGVVCGAYDISQAGDEGERAYWNYQTRIKADEAILAAPIGAHGAFYLFRRSLWSPLAMDTINDDFVLPMTIVLHGHRAVYDRTIMVTELEGSHRAQDFRRRVRIGAGNLQQVLRLAGLGNPRRGLLAFVFLSGKGLRGVLPLLLFAMLLSTIVLAVDGDRTFQFILAGEIAVLMLAATASIGDVLLPRRLDSLMYLVQGHIALAIGAILLLTGRKHLAWGVSLRAKSRARTSDTSV